MFYYYDKNKCNGVSSNRRLSLKTMRSMVDHGYEVHHRYADMVSDRETGNDASQCGMVIGFHAHKSEYYQKGIAWAKENYKNIFRMHMGLFMKAMASRSVNGADTYAADRNRQIKEGVSQYFCDRRE